MLPELVLAVGAMVLLMIGRLQRAEGRRARSPALAVGLLVVTGVLELMLPAGKLVTFGGSFIVDDYRALPEGPGDDRLGRDADPVA